MNDHMSIFLLDLIINLIIVIGYVVWKLIAIFILRRKDAKKGVLIRVFVMLVCPLAGAFYFAVSYLVFKLFLHTEVDLSDVIFGKERVKTHERADEERIRNLAPMEETLVISDRHSQRTMMMNVLRGNVHETLGAVAEGLESDDTETAHYAASILQSELSNFRNHADTEQRTIPLLEDGPDKNSRVKKLLEFINKFLAKHLLNPLEQENYIRLADELGDLLWENDKSLLDGENCELLCSRLIENRWFDLCDKWSERMTEIYPNMLATYTVKIKLCYAKGDGIHFQEAITDLRNSDVVIDTETLDMIHVFSSNL